MIEMYSILRKFIEPIIYLNKLGGKHKEFVNKRYNQNFKHLKKKPTIWLHMSSVGEVNLSETFIKRILDKTDYQIIITIFTDTGFEVANNKFSKNNRVKIFYFPLDNEKIIKNILNKIDLKYLILVETEIWPNLIKEASHFGKVIMINGRISDKSYKRYKKIKFLLKNVFKNIDTFYMQSDVDSERIINLGAKNVITLGNMKFDVKYEEYADKELLKKELNLNKKVMTAGSTRSGEYEIILDTYRNIQKTTQLILVPRHIGNTEKICEILKKYPFKYIKYSENNFNRDYDILIVDKIGILRKLYSISDIAFVGGTLTNIGGHNLLEPLYYGKMVIFGKYLQNVRQISKDILNFELGYKINNSSEFLEAIKKIEKNQSISQKKIKNLFDKNKNITNRLIDRITN